MKEIELHRSQNFFKPLIMIIIISVLLITAVYLVKIRPVMNTPAIIGASSIATDESSILHTGETLEQVFTIPEPGSKGISFDFRQVYENDVNDGTTVEARIIDNKSEEILGEHTIHALETRERNIYQWVFSEELQKKIEKQPDRRYKLILEVNSSLDKNGIVFSLSNNELTSGWKLMVNGEDFQTNLKLDFLSDRGIFLNLMYWGISSLVIVFLVLAYYLVFVKKIKTEKFFLITILFFGLIYLGGLFSPYSGYDEPAHFDTAYRYSNVLMGKGYGSDVKGYGTYLRRVEDSSLGLTPAKTEISNIELVVKNFFKLSQNSELEEVGGRSVNSMAYLYLPSAIGITIARILNLGRIPLFLLGRFFNLLTFTILTYFAIKKIPFGKNILFSISILPLLLEQIASFSYDTIIVGLAFFFIAQCLLMAFSKKEINKVDCIPLFISGVLLAPSKAVYILICLCVLLIPKEKFKSRKKYILFLIFFFLAISCSYLIFSLKFVLMQASETNQMAAFVEKPAYQFSFIYNHPLKFCKLLFNTFLVMFDSFLLMPFKVLYLVELPTFLGIGYMVLLVLSSFKTIEEPLYLMHYHKKLLGIILFLLILSLYSVGIVMTVKDSMVIQGVQGRYLLPAMPIVALLFRNKIIILERNIDKIILFSGCVLESITVILVFINIIGG